MTTYYNENDAYAAQWLRNLIAAGHIPTGDVDERSIVDVRPCDLTGYTQCHFFAGIGGWSSALSLAAWPADRAVWTGSCPCQPFSAAGKGGGFADERHLWPYWCWLIGQCRPATIFGEQVASKQGLVWFDVVHSDLEAAGYACGAAVLPACGVGAPHIRQRLWFVAMDNAMCDGRRTIRNDYAKDERIIAHPDGGEIGGMADTSSEQEYQEQQRPKARERRRSANGLGGCGMANPWSDLDWLPCTDGKARPVEPGTFPLAHGVQRRTSKLRAYGNAIVPQVAAEFIKAAMT